MAEIDDGDYDLKDEELVDFEGSDYGFGSDEELEIDDEVGQPNFADVEGSIVLPSGEGRENQTGAADIGGGGGALQPTGEDVAFSNEAEKEGKEGAESGEIEDEKDDKEDGVVVQPLSSFVLASNNHSYEGREGKTRRNHRKADLEDGELDDAAMPEGSDHEAEGNADDDDDDENERRERKRRKDRFAAERHSESLDRKERESTNLTAARQHRNRGSERPVERSAGFTKATNAGVRGVMQMGGFSHAANMAPGIMGPGRPLVPIDLSTLPLRHMDRGFMGPFTNIQMARTNMQFQEAMAVQEQMLRSHHMMQQLAHASAGGRGRHPMAGPIAGPGMRPMVGIDFGGQLPQGIMAGFQSPGRDLGAQMNFVGPVDTYSRSPRAGYGGRGHGGMFGQVAGRMGSSPRNGMGRQNSWPAGVVQSADLLAVGGGRGQGRGQVAAPIWSEPHVVVPQPMGAQAGLAQNVGVGHSVNMGQARGADVMGIGPAKARQGSQSLGHANQAQRGKQPPGKLEADGTWRIDGERGTKDGAPHKMEKDLRNLTSNTNGSANKRERDVGREKDSNSNLSNSSKCVLTPQGNGVSIGLATASNLIQLGGPVQKSRVLTVSGLPDNTSMSVVVDAFEKQGKVTDFRKEDRGDAFTITFASVFEAISAQRHLHRSHLAGRQITVEYAVPQPDS